MQEDLLSKMDIVLDENELEELDQFLASIPGAMRLETMDGFFAALVCSPKMVMPSQYFSYVWGEDHDFDSMEDAEKYSSLVFRHWNSIASQLQQNDILELVLDDGAGEVQGNSWAQGFMAGMKLGGREWNDYLQDNDNAGVFVPIFMLAHEHDPDPELRPEPIDAERREKLLATIAATVPMMYKYFAPQRNPAQINETSGLPQATYRRDSRKIGRNEPCPCNSGRKYKKCCGRK